MKQTIILVLLAMVCSASWAQSASVGADKISAVADGYAVSITVSPKKATALLAEQIQSKQNTTITVNSEKIEVTYDSETKIYSVDGQSFTSVSDLRKYVRDLIRTKLGIQQ